MDDDDKTEAEQVLAEALDHWKEAVADPDLPVNGGDLVDWFFGQFVPDACKALGRPYPVPPPASQEGAADA
jgi:hypothetical protein